MHFLKAHWPKLAAVAVGMAIEAATGLGAKAYAKAKSLVSGGQ